MPKRAWSAKREREYEHIRAGLDDLSSGRRGGSGRVAVKAVAPAISSTTRRASRTSRAARR